MRRYELDWFECSIWPRFVAVDEVISWIKKNLKIKLNPCGSKGYYNEGSINEDFGIYLFYFPKPKCQNSPIYLRLTGKFFQLSGHAEEFINILLSSGTNIVPTRIDACIDFISTEKEPEVIPIPTKIQKFGKHSPVEFRGDYDNGITSYECGKTDSRLRVYNKLLENCNYQQDYGFSDLGDVGFIWRLEHQFRGKSLKSRLKNERSWTYETLIEMVLGQCGRRFTFDNFEIPVDRFSGYSPRNSSLLEKKIHFERLAIKNFRRMVMVENLMEPSDYLYKEPLNQIAEFDLEYAAYADKYCEVQ